MEEYISKSAVVAKLERLISNGQTELKESEECKDYESYVVLAERIATYINVLSFLDTLEVKEVNLTEEEKMFPELQESEDERIRKALIDYFDDANKSDVTLLQSYGIQTHKVIDWLEKQGEPIDKEKNSDRCKCCNNIKGCVTCVDGSEWAHIYE